MRKNRKKASIFTQMAEAVNSNVGKVVTSSIILLGKEPGESRGAAICLYRLLSLGYVKAVNGGFATDKDTMYEIIKPVPPYYDAAMLEDEYRIANGLIPKNNYQHKIY